MAMTLDLENLPYTTALEIIQFCYENEIDLAKCVQLVRAMGVSPVPDIEWNLTVPESFATMAVLKWGYPAGEVAR